MTGISHGNHDLARDGVAFRQAAIYATDSEYQAFLGSLSAVIVEALSRPSEGRRRRLVTPTLMPAVESESTQAQNASPASP